MNLRKRFFHIVYHVIAFRVLPAVSGALGESASVGLYAGFRAGEPLCAGRAVAVLRFVAACGHVDCMCRWFYVAEGGWCDCFLQLCKHICRGVYIYDPALPSSFTLRI